MKSLMCKRIRSYRGLDWLRSFQMGKVRDMRTMQLRQFWSLVSAKGMVISLERWQLVQQKHWTWGGNIGVVRWLVLWRRTLNQKTPTWTLMRLARVMIGVRHIVLLGVVHSLSSREEVMYYIHHFYKKEKRNLIII